MDGNLNTTKKTTEVLLGVRWEDRLEEDAGTAVSNYVISMVLWVNDQLHAQLRCIKVYYCNPLHVSNNTVLIIRRSNCINKASGIVFSVSDRPVCSLHNGRSLTESTINAVSIQFDLLMISTVLFETCRGLQ